jgi:hypothetical protein
VELTGLPAGAGSNALFIVGLLAKGFLVFDYHDRASGGSRPMCRREDACSVARWPAGLLLYGTSEVMADVCPE